MASRLFDYFAVYGLKEPISILSDENQDSLDNVNTISRIRVVITSAEANLRNQAGYRQYHEMVCKEGYKAWLEIMYSKIKGIQNPELTADAPTITAVAFYYMPIEGKYTVVPAEYNMEPVPVIEQGYAHAKVRFEGGNYYYTGNYSLTRLLGAKDIGTHQLVLMYKISSGSGELPLVDIKLTESTQRQSATGAVENIINLPDTNFEYLPFGFGNSKSTYVIFKHQKNPIQCVYKPDFIEKFPREDYPDSALSEAIHMFAFPSGIQLSKEQDPPSYFSFILTTVEEDTRVPRIYVTCLVFYELANERISQVLNLHISANNKVYVPKAICLISHWPYVDNFREILKQIYRISMSTSPVPLERIVCNLLQEIPLPDQGITKIQYSIGNATLEFLRPPPKYYPIQPEQCFEFLFRSLSIEDVVTLWTCVMLEKKILLISTHKALLTHVAMAITSLIFPFKWDQVLIPILPKQLKNYIETILPYIIGISPDMLTADIEVPIDAVKVYLDESKMHVAEFIPRLPDKARRCLVSRLNQVAGVFQRNDPIIQTVDEAFNWILFAEPEDSGFYLLAVKDAFLEFQFSTMRNYHRYLKHPEKLGQQFMDFRDCFNTAGFLSYHKATKPTTYLYKFVETSIFTKFIEDITFKNEENIDGIEYFNEGIRFKRTKTNPLYVRRYGHSKVEWALEANDIGLDLNDVFRYDCFPELEDANFVEPRAIKVFDTGRSSKVILTLKDDSLQKYNASDWAKFLLFNIYSIWFTVFTTCMSRFRTYADLQMNLALSILDGMKKAGCKPDEDIYRKLIEACGRCGLKERVLTLFKKMKNQGIEPDACTHGVYVKAVAYGQELMNKVDIPTEQEVSGLPEYLRLENVVLLPTDSCPNCEVELSQQEIMEGWERSYSNYNTKCSKDLCGSRFVPRFTVVIEAEMPSEASMMGSEAQNHAITFMSPPILRKELEKVIYSQGDSFLLAKNFCDKHSELFWNLVLYFNLINAPAFFLDPNIHEDEVKEQIMARMEVQPKASRPRITRQLSSSSLHFDDSRSDAGSHVSSNVSGRSGASAASYSGKLNFMETRSRSSASSNRSSRSSANPQIKKIFGGMIDKLNEENVRKGRALDFGYQTEYSNPN